MKKTVVKLGLCTLLATNLLILSEAVPGVDGFVFASDAPKVEMQAEAQKIKGKITNISQKAKTIALTQKDNNFFLLKFNDETELIGVKSTNRRQGIGSALLKKSVEWFKQQGSDELELNVYHFSAVFCYRILSPIAVLSFPLFSSILFPITAINSL